MDRAHVNGVELEHEVVGAGEPVLLISPVLADGFRPLLAQPALADGYQLVSDHRRGWSGSTCTAGPVSIVDHAAEDADTFFGLELPSLGQWDFGPDQAAGRTAPVLSLRGGDTLPLWVEVAQFLSSNVPSVKEHTVEGVGHLLHLQDPEAVGRAMADFLRRHPLAA